MSGSRRASLAFLIASIGIIPASSLAGPLDPTQFVSLGTLSLTTPGTYLISGTSLIAGGMTYTGVTYNGITVFDFSSVNIGSGVTLSSVDGNPNPNPIAILSRTVATIAGTIDVSANGNLNGPGATNMGVGGSGSSGNVNTSSGSGGFYATGGGGGGFGGAGGQGGGAFFPMTSIPGGAGGIAYGNLTTLLQGGSAGGVSGNGSNAYIGGGGGAIEIGAVNSLSISGGVYAVGGQALAYGDGGGSGGGIFLHAGSVSLSGSIEATGGMGAPGINAFGPTSAGGNGGGGQILVEYSSGLSTTGAYISAAGAQNGTITLIPSVPEPSSLILLGTSGLGLLVAAAFGRLRRGRAAADPSR